MPTALKKTAGLLFAVVVSLGLYGAISFIQPLLPDFAFTEGLYPQPRGTIANSVTQTLIVMFAYVAFLALILRLPVIRRSISEIWERVPIQGWIAAAITVAIQVGIILAFFIDDPHVIFEPSLFNLHMSLATALGGGVVEEIIYRGFAILTLLAFGFSRFTAVVVSALLFAFSHVGWISFQDLSVAQVFIQLSPVWGTLILGLALGHTFLASNCRLGPVIVAHALINIIIEPWLLLALLGGSL